MNMTASKKFRIGDRVTWTRVAYRRHIPRGRGKFGKIVGYNREAELVRVLVDGLTTSRTFHISFWKKTT